MDIKFRPDHAFATEELITLLLINNHFDRTESPQYEIAISELRNMNKSALPSWTEKIVDVLSLGGFNQGYDGLWRGSFDNVLASNRRME